MYQFVLLSVFFIVIGALIPLSFNNIKKAFYSAREKKAKKKTRSDSIESELNNLEKHIDDALTNHRRRIEAIERKLGEVEVDSFGHMIENPMPTPLDIVKKIKKEEDSNGDNTWKVL